MKSSTTVGGAHVTPLLDASWHDVTRHRARLEVIGGNLKGAESNVTARASFYARPGSNAVWCLTRTYSYQPAAGQQAGTIAIALTVRHRDGTRSRSKPMTWRYVGSPTSAGNVSGVVVASDISKRPIRRGDVVTIGVSLELEGPVVDLQESVDVTAC